MIRRARRAQVLVGLQVVTDEAVVWGFSAVCAPLTLIGTADQLGVSIGEPVLRTDVIGAKWGTTPITRAVMCPAGAVVNAVTGTTWFYEGELGSWTTTSIREITLACSDIAVDAMRRVVFAPKSMLTIGNQANLAGTFNDPCPAGHAVAGFKGYAGEWIDGLQTHCSEIAVAGTPAADASASGN